MTTPYEDAIADGVTEVQTLIGDTWPIIVAIVVGTLGFKFFRRAAK